MTADVHRDPQPEALGAIEKLRAPKTDTSSPEIREAIQHAALKIAAAEGVKGASLRRIAGEVGLRTATVYSFFPGGKDELIAKALMDDLRRFLDFVIPNEQSRPSSSYENLRRIIFAHTTYSMRHQGIVPAWETIIRADRTYPFLADDARRVIHGLQNQYYDAVILLLKDLGFRGLQAERYAQLIGVTCDGVSNWYAAGPEQESSVEAPAEFIWQAVVRMLGLSISAQKGDAT